jgi:DNA-binding PadR family transcriptional regulator
MATRSSATWRRAFTDSTRRVPARSIRHSNITSLAQDAKKIYTITEEGKKFLIEKEKETDEIKANMRSWWGGWSSEFKDEMRDVMRSVGDMGRMIAQQARKAGAEKIPQVKEALKNATAEIERIFKS